MRPALAALLGCALALGPGAALAQGTHGAGAAPAADTRTPEERARARWPQPVRVGDLVGRPLLRNAPQQTVLGRVAGVVRGVDGAEAILVDAGGALGLGTRRVAVPVFAVALLGQFVVLMDLDPAALAALPAAPAGATLAPTDVIRVGLTRN